MMNMKSDVNIFAIGLAAAVLSACGGEPQLSEHNIDKVVKAMTPEEKALLVTGIEMDKGTDIHTAVIGASAQKVAGAAGATHAIPRLGIPSVVLADGPAGLRIAPTREGEERTYYCTHFPIASLLSSTWNQALVEEVGRAIGNEALEYGVDILLAPALNIHRNPLNGRNFEYYSEDPFLSGKIASSYVRGIQSNGVGTSLKHFAANNHETNRTGVDVRVDERTLREIYLRGYEITVNEADPWTVMTSYNKINGLYTSEDPHLLQDILRDDWGFGGAVVTDWFGGKDTKAQMRAGNDMLQPGRVSQYEEIVSGVKDGSLDEECLDRNVAHILSLIVRTPTFRKYRYGNSPDLTAHAAVTRRSAAEGMVLLENRNEALPLSAGERKVALFGNTSYRFIAGGSGSGNVNRAYTVSLLEGLSNAGLTVDAGLRGKYEAAIARDDEAAARAGKEENPFMAELPLPLPADYVPSVSEIEGYAKADDVAVITLGRRSGEFLDRTDADFNLSANERRLITEVSCAFRAEGKKTVVVLNVGGVIETASWKDIPDAVLLSWQAGQEGGNSVADVLTGKENPSGRLPMTWPVSWRDHKSSENFPRAEDYSFNFDAFLGKEKAPGNVKDYDWCNYAEGIYVGYRWFDKAGLKVSYPFGYGLSYTAFSYGEPRVTRDGDRVRLSLSVKNVGKRAGKEVVELYVAAPGKTLEKPAKELRAFAKTGLLAPGASEEVVLEFAVPDLASYNPASSSWEVEDGVYTILVGASCTDIRRRSRMEI